MHICPFMSSFKRSSATHLFSANLKGRANVPLCTIHNHIIVATVPHFPSPPKYTFASLFFNKPNYARCFVVFLGDRTNTANEFDCGARINQNSSTKHCARRYQSHRKSTERKHEWRMRMIYHFSDTFYGELYTEHVIALSADWHIDLCVSDWVNRQFFEYFLFLAWHSSRLF